MGVKQFTQLATVSLSATTVSLSSNPATAIPSGGSESVTFYAAVGTIIRPVGYGCTFPAVPGGTGLKNSTVNIQPAGVDQTEGVGADNTNVVFRGSCWAVASVSAQPAVGVVQLVGGWVLDSVTGATFIATNGSASAQTATRSYVISGVQEAIV